MEKNVLNIKKFKDFFNLTVGGVNEIFWNMVLKDL